MSIENDERTPETIIRDTISKDETVDSDNQKLMSDWNERVENLYTMLTQQELAKLIDERLVTYSYDLQKVEDPIVGEYPATSMTVHIGSKRTLYFEPLGINTIIVNSNRSVITGAMTNKCLFLKWREKEWFLEYPAIAAAGAETGLNPLKTYGKSLQESFPGKDKRGLKILLLHLLG